MAHDSLPGKVARAIGRIRGDDRDSITDDVQVVGQPIFIGGTGRSGTWVVGQMLGKDESLATVYTELRFHAVPKGFRAVLSAKMTADEYADSVLEKWFEPPGGVKPKGLQLIVTRSELSEALDRFRVRAKSDLSMALATLMHDLVDHFALRRRATRWAETTPDNAAAASALTRVFPAARVIHVVRDGRDAATSVTAMGWGPTNVMDGLEWWGRRMKAAQKGMAAADPERVLTVRIEELIHLERGRAFEHLTRFAGVAGSEPVFHYFESSVDAAKGQVGRWRREVDAHEQDSFNGRYRELLEELRAEGGSALPTDPERVDEMAR